MKFSNGPISLPDSASALSAQCRRIALLPNALRMREREARFDQLFEKRHHRLPGSHQFRPVGRGNGSAADRYQVGRVAVQQRFGQCYVVHTAIGNHGRPENAFGNAVRRSTIGIQAFPFPPTAFGRDMYIVGINFSQYLKNPPRRFRTTRPAVGKIIDFALRNAYSRYKTTGQGPFHRLVNLH